MSVLTIVLFFGLVVGGMAFATHSLWQNSSRTMFSVQEHRELVNLSRSCLAEAYFQVQRELDHLGGTDTFYWFIHEGTPPPRRFGVERTVAAAGAMGSDPLSGAGNVRFQVLNDGKVDLIRRRGMPSGPARYSAQGIVDLRVEVEVTRIRPRHRAQLVVVARHYYRLEQHPFSPWYTGDKIFISKTPIGTWIEDEIGG